MQLQNTATIYPNEPCPKCGNPTWYGPRWKIENAGPMIELEYLEFECCHCYYPTKLPCLDAKGDTT